MSTETQRVDVLVGPAERSFDGWSGTNAPIFRLDHACGCRSTESGSLYSVCLEHMTSAVRRSNENAALARIGGAA
jgi:hypothetical protein